jgi:membrane peptidoglycan carboxypeptidase
MTTSGSRTTSVSGVVTLLGALLATALVAGLLGAGLLMPAVGAAGAIARGGVHAFDSLPAELQQSPLAQQSKILAADGSVIATFYDENRIVVPLAKVSQTMQTAIVAIEDDRFYEHGGVDLHGLARAFVNNAQGGGTQGASTITQQFVKNTLVENAKADGDEAALQAAINRDGTSGYARKLQELKYAVGLEKTMNKPDILQGYLNIAYFGAGTYGVEAAALHYFGVHASALNLPQSALLAGLVQSPSRYDPYLNMNAGVARRNVVLARMLKLKNITPAQYTTAVKTKVVLHKTTAGNDCTSSKYPYFCDYVRRVLSKTEGIGAAALQRGGLTVRTTLQPKLQNAAQKSINSYVDQGNKSKVGSAATTVEPGTGKVLSMVQSSRFKIPATTSTKKSKRTWDTTQVNWNADFAYGGSHGFPTGSTFKAYTLAAALKKGLKLNDTVLAPGNPATFTGYQDCSGDSLGTYTVHNAENSGERGNITLLRATQDSINVAFASLEKEVGVCAVATMAETLGVHRAFALPKHTDLNLLQVASLTLGVNEVAPMTMAAGYATFAANGLFCHPIVITSITSATGKKYSAPKAGCHQVIQPDVAKAVTYALQRVITSGTGAGLSLSGRESAGKTGTGQFNDQAWFVGYTPQLATAVYVGHPNQSTRTLNGMHVGGRSYGTVFGATIAGPIWRSIMDKAGDILNLPSRTFDSPPSSMIGSPPAKPKKPKPNPTGGPTGTPTGGPTGPTGKPCKPSKCPPPPH